MPDPYVQEYRITVDFYGAEADADILTDIIVNAVLESNYREISIKRANGSIISLGHNAFMRSLDNLAEDE